VPPESSSMTSTPLRPDAAKPRDRKLGPGPVGVASVRIIAAWEVVKGVLVLLAAGLFVKFIAPDTEHAVERIVAHFHLNPAGHTSRIFEKAAENLADTRLVLLALGAGLYALLRFVEGYGLWFARPWGVYLGIVSAALYLPFEVDGMIDHFTLLGFSLFAINVVIIVLLWFNRTKHAPA